MLLWHNVACCAVNNNNNVINTVQIHRGCKCASSTVLKHNAKHQATNQSVEMVCVHFYSSVWFRAVDWFKTVGLVTGRACGP